MLIRDVEMFIEHCENKGLATKTIGSYEQTLRLLMLYLDEQGITQTEKITHTVIQNYVRQIKERGKYTVTSNPNSGNYQERRLDFGKKVSDVTINNYLRNMSAFFGWCVEEDLILRSPVKRGDYIKVERRPLEFVSDEDFRKLLRNMNTASFSEYRDSIVIQLLLDMPKEAAKIVYENVHKALNERENDETGKNAPQIVTSVKSSAEQIREYKGLLDDGIITQTEFDAKKKELLNL